MRRNQKYFLILIILPMPLIILVARNNSSCCLFGRSGVSINEDALNSISAGRNLNMFVLDEQEDSDIDKHDFEDSMIMSHEDAEESVKRMCVVNPSLPKSLKDLSKKHRNILLSHLIVNDEYKFIYCYTPKVACSNWKKVVKLLYGNLREEDLVRMDHKNGFKYLSQYSDAEIAKKLKTYYKFMFIRNPTERALSVYRNKFNEIESFYRVYGSKIMSMYHKDAPTYKGKVPGDDVSFADFLRYIATGVEAENMNEHYMPMTLLCQPCVVNYDFIGIYDNLADDSEAVLRAIKAPDDVHFPVRQSWYKPTTDSYLHYYFSLISPRLLEDFVDKYSLDYTMFSFSKPYFTSSHSPYKNHTFHLR